MKTYQGKYLSYVSETWPGYDRSYKNTLTNYGNKPKGPCYLDHKFLPDDVVGGTFDAVIRFRILYLRLPDLYICQRLVITDVGYEESLPNTFYHIKFLDHNFTKIHTYGQDT